MTLEQKRIEKGAIVHKLSVMYGKPKDTEAFEKYYSGTHAALAGKIPNVKKLETSVVVATPDGSDLPFYRVAEITFADLETLQASMGSDEGKAVSADLENFATGGATAMISQLD